MSQKNNKRTVQKQHRRFESYPKHTCIQQCYPYCQCASQMHFEDINSQDATFYINFVIKQLTQ